MVMASFHSLTLLVCLLDRKAAIDLGLFYPLRGPGPKLVARPYLSMYLSIYLSPPFFLTLSPLIIVFQTSFFSLYVF